MIILANAVSIKADEGNYMLFDNLTGNIYKLNELSYEILSLCDGKNTDEDIISCIIKDFEVTRQEAKNDFNVLMQILSDKQYIIDNDIKKRR